MPSALLVVLVASQQYPAQKEAPVLCLPYIVVCHHALANIFELCSLLCQLGLYMMFSF